MNHLSHLSPHVVSAMLEGNILAEYLTCLDSERVARRNRRFEFSRFSESDSWCKFRFTKADIQRLQTALGIPDKIRFSTRIVETGENALLLLLRRLAYLNRLVDIADIFPRSEGELSIIFNETLEYIYTSFGYLLEDVSSLYWLSPEYLETYSAAVMRKGSPLTHCWGFIDGTARPMCRPSVAQVVVFSGHKRCHCLKFQSVMVPNGMICHMFGPIEGRRHDAMLLRLSGLLDQLQEPNFRDVEGNPYVLFRDPAYPTREHLISPFKGANLSEIEEAFNSKMSKVRQCVEWGFCDITSNWSFVDFKRNLKVLLQPIAKYYLVATILTNCRCTLYGNQTSAFFGVEPPSLENYLHNRA